MNKVTRSILAFFLVFSLGNTLSGKGITGMGIKGGVNAATVVSDSVDSPDMIIGTAVGGFITYQLNDKFSIQPELLYTSKGYKSGIDILFASIKQEVKMNYLEIPILGVYSLNEKFSVYAGPSLGLFLNGEAKAEISLLGETESDTQDIDSPGIDFGLAFGASFSYGMFNVDARYSMGLKENELKVDDILIDTIKNNGLLLLVVFEF